MSDEKLLSKLKSLREESSAGNAELRKNIKQAIDAYLEASDKDADPDRSNVRSRDVMEQIDELSDDICQTVATPGNVIGFKPAEVTEEDLQDESGQQKTAEDVAAQREDDARYQNISVERILYSEHGRGVVEHWVKSGLLMKIGVMQVVYDKPGMSHLKSEIVDSEGYERLQKDAADIVSAESVGDDEVNLPKIQYRTKDKTGQVRIAYHHPFDFYVSPHATHFDQTKSDGPEFIGVRQRVSVASLKQDFPDKARFISASSDGETGSSRSLLFGDVNAGETSEQDEVTVYHEFVRMDYDDDDHVELRHVISTDGLILYNEEVEDNDLVVWTPYSVPGRAIGMSAYDKMADIQIVKTRLLQNATDNTNDSSASRLAITEAIDQNDALNLAAGRQSLLRQYTDPSNPLSMQPIGSNVIQLPVPYTADKSMVLMEALTRSAEKRLGTAPSDVGTNPRMLDNTATGAGILDERASTKRVRLLQRAADGLAVAYSKIRDKLRKYHDGELYIGIENGQVKKTNPRAWQALGVNVEVGASAARQAQKIGFMMQVIGLQSQAQQAGLKIEPRHFWRSASQLLGAMGYNNPEMFFGSEPVRGEQVPEQQDPKAQIEKMKAEAQAQAEQVKMQMEQQKVQMQIELEKYKAEQKLMLEKIIAENKLALEELIAKLEIQSQERIAGTEIAAEAAFGKQANAKTRVDVGGEPG